MQIFINILLRFVIQTGKEKNTVTENLYTAFERLTESGLSPMWIKEAEVAKLSPTKMVKLIILWGELVSRGFKSS